MTASDTVNPFFYYNAEPAPMGIADFGIGDSGAYRYASNSTLGVVSIRSLSVDNGTGNTQMSLQLNENLQFTSGGQLYDYWIQDVAYLDTSGNNILFLDNIWNFSSAGAEITSGLSGSGQIQVPPGFYYDVAQSSLPGNQADLTYPTTLYLELNSTVTALGQPQVAFAYNDGLGWVTYDTVTFTGVSHLASLPGFVVDGFNYNPLGLYYDSELTLGGPGGGSSTRDVGSDVSMQLWYWNGNDYQQITSAYNFGSDTAETMRNALSLYASTPADGQPVAEVRASSGTLGVLYDRALIGLLTVTSMVKAGALQVRNLGDQSANPSRTSFVAGNVTVVLAPGTYFYQVYSGATLYASGNATITAGSDVRLAVHQQNDIVIVFAYSVLGGSSGSSGPVLSYTSSGTALTAVLTAAPTAYYLDPGTSWSVSSQLPGSTSTERWAADNATSGTASSPQNSTFVYYHQFQLSAGFAAVGGNPQSYPVLSYANLGSPSTLTLSSAFQSVWADSGTAVSLVVRGAGDRLEGTGWRIASYSVNGVSTTLATAGQVTILEIPSLSSPQTVVLRTVAQYLLTTGSGSLSSITSPPIPGDAGWYDSGTEVTAEYDYSWNLTTAPTRQNALGYSIDQGQESSLPRAAAGTFPVLVEMDAPHAIAVDSVTQYGLTVSGGSAVTLSEPSPTNDSFVDAGTEVAVTTDNVWGLTNGSTRQNLVAYALDGATHNVTRSGSGSFTTPPFTVDSPESLSFTSVTQYLVGFEFRDASGSIPIEPTSLEIQLADATIVPVSGFRAWLDAGSSFRIWSLTWEGADVAPKNQTALTVGGPTTEVIGAAAYAAKLDVTDELGIPVSGAAVSATFYNGTTVHLATSGSGQLDLGLVPVGSYQGQITYLGFSTSFSADASRETPTTARVAMSYPMLLVITLIAAAVAAAALMAVRRRPRTAQASS